MTTALQVTNDMVSFGILNFKGFIPVPFSSRYLHATFRRRRGASHRRRDCNHGLTTRGCIERLRNETLSNGYPMPDRNSADTYNIAIYTLIPLTLHVSALRNKYQPLQPCYS